jgi:hypothetical protein
MAAGWKDALMADTGAPWNIPYVEPSDLVRDYPAADEAQALAIAAGLTDASLIRQVVSTSKTDTFSASVAVGDFSGDVTGLTVSITPQSASNKVLVLVSIGISGAAPNIGLFRDGSIIFSGDAAGSRTRRTAGSALAGDFHANQISVIALDAPNAVTAVVYSVRLGHDASGTTNVFVNRASADSDSNRTSRTSSFITAIEVAA